MGTGHVIGHKTRGARHVVRGLRWTCGTGCGVRGKGYEVWGLN